MLSLQCGWGYGASQMFTGTTFIYRTYMGPVGFWLYTFKAKSYLCRGFLSSALCHFRCGNLTHSLPAQLSDSHWKGLSFTSVAVPAAHLMFCSRHEHIQPDQQQHQLDNQFDRQSYDWAKLRPGLVRLLPICWPMSTCVSAIDTWSNKKWIAITLWINPSTEQQKKQNYLGKLQ